MPTRTDTVEGPTPLRRRAEALLGEGHGAANDAILVVAPEVVVALLHVPFGR